MATDDGTLADLKSAWYKAHVSHTRHAPVHNRFRYPLFSFYVNLEELPRLHRNLPLFSWNRWNIYSFHDADHGWRDGRPARAWAIQVCQDTLHRSVDTVYLLCLPRLFGYVFNPISVFFCYRQGVLQAVLYEVCNAYKQRHTYAMPVEEGGGTIHHTMEKRFYVSPYLPMECVYRAELTAPAEIFSLAIHQEHQGQEIFTATYEGERCPFTRSTLVQHLAAYPLMTLAVVRRILWQALTLRLKGLRFQRPPPPIVPNVSSGVVQRKSPEQRAQ
jgi:uncharacterized protein